MLHYPPPSTNVSLQTATVSVPSSLRDRFLVYGPRATSSGASRAPSGLLDYLATWRVPHRYFTQFYVVSLLSSVFWGIQLFVRGRVFQAIASRVSQEHQLQSMSIAQVIVCWMLLAIQGSRRLWECMSFSKPSSSQMWVVHWLLGLAFYLAAGVAIWIEGSGETDAANGPILPSVLTISRFSSIATNYSRGFQDHHRPQHPHFPLRPTLPRRIWHPT